MRLFLKLIWLALVAALMAGFAGALHPIGDSLSVFRPQVLVLLATASGLLWGLRMGVWAALGAVFVLVAGLPLLVDPKQRPAGASVTLYQKNMLVSNPDLGPLEADIRAMAPDVLTLQEVSVKNRPILNALSDLLPYQQFCHFGGVGEVAVASRFPVVEPGICAKGLAALHVDGPGGPMWLVSVHLRWPWPYQQAKDLAEILPQIAALDGPVLIAGDFNMVRWSHALAEVRRAARVLAAGRILGSFPQFAPLATLPIDQVMSPGGGQVEMRPLLGSDHYGLFATLRSAP